MVVLIERGVAVGSLKRVEMLGEKEGRGGELALSGSEEGGRAHNGRRPDGSGVLETHGRERGFWARSGEVGESEMVVVRV